MPKKKISTWDAEEWFYTELLQCGPVSEEWAKREFKKKYYLQLVLYLYHLYQKK